MRFSTIVKMGAVVAAAASMCVANADTTGLSLRLGTFIPSNSSATDLSSTWFAFGGDYKLSTLSASVPVVGTQAYFGISADYYSHGSDNDAPIALTYNVRQGPMLFSAGVGPDFRDSGDLTSTGVGIGEQVAFAYELGSLPTPVFLEAKYFFSSRPELSGLGLYVGVRF